MTRNLETIRRWAKFRPSAKSRLTLVCLLTIFAVCGIALTPNEAISKIAGLLSGAGAAGFGPSTPSITSITLSVPPGTYTSGTVTASVNFSAPVTATGTITLPYNTTPTQGVASCTPASNVTTLSCSWSIGTNQSANPLATTASGLVINGGSIVATTGGAPANLALAVSYTFAGVIVNPTGTPTVVTGCAISPSSGLFTVSGSVGGGNTAIVTCTFSGPESVNATAPNVPTITLSVGTVCPYSSGSTTMNISFSCTFISGQNTFLQNESIWLRTASSNAILLNGGSINNGGVPATLSGANNQLFKNVVVDTTSPYFTIQGGSGSGCSWASPCTPAAAQTQYRTTPKNIWVLASGGTYTGLATSNVDTNSGAYPTAPVYILSTTADNNQTWIGYPGQTPFWDGACTSAALYNPTPGCVFAPFGGGTNTGNGVAGLTVQYITFEHYYGAGFYEWFSTGLLVANDQFIHFYNTCGNSAGGDGSPCNGAGGAIALFAAWSNAQFLHNNVEDFAGFGTTFNVGDQTSIAAGYTLTFTIDSNNFMPVPGSGGTIGTCNVISDCGAIYTGYDNNFLTGAFGAHRGTVSNNFVNGVGSFNNAGACFYNDQGTSGVDTINNICTGVYTWGAEIDRGSEDTYSGNIFDITAIAGNTVNDTVYFQVYANGWSGGCNLSCPAQTGFTIGKQIVYNGSTTTAPPAWMGLHYSGSGQGTPTFSSDWYATAFGSFVNPYQWAGPTFSSGASGVNDSSGTLVSAATLFANPSAQTPAGYLLQTAPGTAGAAILSAGGTQPHTDQGPL